MQRRCRSAACRQVSYLCIVTIAPAARCSLLGAAVLPHGDFAYDPGLLIGRGPPSAVAQARALRSGARAAGRFVAGLGADVLVLSTPHGAAVSEALAVYGNTRLEGPALLGRDVNASFGEGTAGPGHWLPFAARGDPARAQRIVARLNDAVAGSATVLEGWGDDLPLPLRWGEVLPLRFVAPEGNLLARGSPSLVVLSLPLARRGSSGSLLEEFRHLGQALGGLISEDSGTRYALVVSSDLSHTRWENTTFGRSELAAGFDRACGAWASSLEWRALQAQRHAVDSVYCCGWLGFALLQGALEGAGGAWRGEVLAAPAAPTYYGMMAAAFRPSGGGGGGGPAVEGKKEDGDAGGPGILV